WIAPKYTCGVWTVISKILKRETRYYVRAHPVLHTMWVANKIGLTVSDTHKARRSASPGHHTGWGEEQNCSGGLKSGRSCFCSGDRCFQFLSLRLSETLDKSHAVICLNLMQRYTIIF